MNKNKWKSSRGLKVALTITSFVMAAIVFCSAAAVILIGNLYVYGETKEECLKVHYERYSEIYAVMAMANRESPVMQEELNKTNFRYGIIKEEDAEAEGITELEETKKISDPASYEYYNFEKMPAVDAIENDEVDVWEYEIGEGTRYSWDCRLFGYADVYNEVYDEVNYNDYAAMEEVPIIGYYYNVSDGIFYYETEDECYRVDDVKLFVGDVDMQLRFKFDSGQGAYYNLDREACVVNDYYLTFDAFDDFTGKSWETWSTITLDDVEFFHTDIRFVEDEDTENGEFLGKPIAKRFYSYSDGSEVLKVRAEETVKEEAEAQNSKTERYWVISEVREPLAKTGIRNSILEGDLFEQITYVLNYAYAWRYPAIVILIVSLILWAVSTVFVLIMAGHKGRYRYAGDDAAGTAGSVSSADVGTGRTAGSVSCAESGIGRMADGTVYAGSTAGTDGEDTGAVQDTLQAEGAGGVMPAETSAQEDTDRKAGMPGREDGAEESGSGSRTGRLAAEMRWMDEVKPGFWQKIPLDVETALIALLGCVLIAVGVEFTYYGLSPWNITLAVICCAGCYIISFIWLVDFVVRVKLGKWWRSMFVYKCCAWIWRKVSGFVKKIVRFCQENISLLGKAILILGGISLLEGFGILMTGYAPGAELSIWFLYRAATVVLILLGIVQANKLKEGAGKLADGDLQEKIDTEKMFWEFKKHGDALNSIHDGISLAVEKRMQSEHFRTELITNVSHDIKTPLTSIINYVDLLQKEEIDNEKAKEYLEVLSRQSSRLKKLTEDLIEASKASTGSMPVQMEQIELGVFLTQTVGEFEEKLTSAGLHVVMHKPETEVFVNADGKHLWRVVENLVQNICKYAQAGTRVYIDLDEGEKEAMISFKNISRYELNISGDELMERFVRGDASRHTEGSGLGLSIAGSLMELMHGKLEIAVDGDLFKVVLHFPR